MIELIRRVVDLPAAELVHGIGDDAAVMRSPEKGRLLLLTTDMLVEGTHFKLDMISAYQLGWKALAVNLSDIAAMGGMPSYALVSLALPGHTEVEDVTALYRGMIELAKKFGVAIVGGNVSGAPVLMISITVLGTAEGEKKMLTRSAARPGEKVAVTNYLGASAAGLEMLSKGLSFKPAAAKSLRKAFLTPIPRVVEGRLLVKQGVRAGIDISDGLLADLRHICQMSQVGARIEIERVPVHPAVKANFGSRALELALGGGEDYELLFTASAEVIDKVKAAASCPITVIGEVTAEKAGEIILVDGKGSPIDPAVIGWQHFTKRQS